ASDMIASTRESTELSWSRARGRRNASRCGRLRAGRPERSERLSTAGSGYLYYALPSNAALARREWASTRRGLRPARWQLRPHLSNLRRERARPVQRFKTIDELDSGRVRLFDMTVDPRETTDIAHEHPERTARFERRIKSLR